MERDYPFSQEETKHIHQLHQKFKFTQSEIREIKDFLFLIKYRLKTPISSIIEDINLKLEDKYQSLPPKLKRKEIRYYLRKIAYPLLSSYEEKFSARKDLLERRIKGVKFFSPPYFEEDSLKIVIYAKDKDDLKEKLNLLQKEQNFEEISELFSIIRGSSC